MMKTISGSNVGNLQPLKLLSRRSCSDSVATSKPSVKKLSCESTAKVNPLHSISTCQNCHLSETCRTVGMQGYGDPKASLILFLDSPTFDDDHKGRFGFSDSTKLLSWLIQRAGLSLREGVRIEYTLRCAKPKRSLSTKAARAECIEACSEYRFATLQTLKPKAIVAMGAISCEAFLAGCAHGKKEGWHWETREKSIASIVSRTWVTYSPGYAIEKPAEVGRIYRVIFRAAEAAGLKPQFNPNVKPFPFEI